MQFQVFLSLWSVTSCWYIDKIPKVSNPKRYFFIKVKTHPCPPKTPHLNTPPRVYVTVWDDLHNTARMFRQRKRS